jgi:hypothetical protein
VSKRVYVAGPWLERWDAKAIADKFKEAGFTITREWWYDDEERPGHDPAVCALLDWEGVQTADCVVVLNTIKSEGKAVEQGLALAHDVPICLIGRTINNIFQNMYIIEKVDSVDEALKWAESILQEA